MTKQSPFAMFLVVLASQACAGSPIHTGNQAVGDASDATWVRPGADSAGISDVARVPDRAAAQDLPPDLNARICGTGRIDPGEECDDGNTLSGDGCSATCRIECGDGPCYREFCGDGKLAWNDECDDGNFTDGDGCSGYCKVESGFRCSVPGRPCTGICGDRAVKGAETCDDGNTLDGDGCSSICVTEPGWDCGGSSCVPVTSADGGGSSTARLYCGDGLLSGSEECDDGLANSDTAYGGCGSKCRISRCGNGLLNGVEECDCGDNYLGHIDFSVCAVRPQAIPYSYCHGCEILPDIGY